MTLPQLKALESDGNFSVTKKKADGIAFLLRNFGEEANSNKVILVKHS
jgi:hypothetical protein